MMKPGWKGIYLLKYEGKCMLFDQCTQQIAVKLMTYYATAFPSSLRLYWQVMYMFCCFINRGKQSGEVNISLIMIETPVMCVISSLIVYREKIRVYPLIKNWHL